MSNVQHSSESNEHSTPQHIADGARQLMGGITLDPASSKLANTIIRAKRFYTKKENGYLRPWKGNVFWNPPGGICEFQTGREIIKSTKDRAGCKVTGACGLPPGPLHKHVQPTSSAKAWWFQGAKHYEAGLIRHGFFVGFTLEILQSTQTEYPDGSRAAFIPAQFPYCIPNERLEFLVEDEDGKLQPGEEPTHANVLVYLPFEWSKQEQKKFEEIFSPIGHCTWPNKKVRR